MKTVFICDAIRTAIGRYGGSLSSVRTDDLAAIPLRALLQRNSKADWEQLDEVTLGCANQAGEDNRNVARMALLLAGIPQSVSGSTVNRLCASGMEAIGSAARAIAAGEIEFAIERDDVGFSHLGGGMGQALGEVAIVGEIGGAKRGRAGGDGDLRGRPEGPIGMPVDRFQDRLARSQVVQVLGDDVDVVAIGM